jgi:hypothetical protein
MSDNVACFRHETLAVVLQVRAGRLSVLLWQRAAEPFLGSWSLPGGYLSARATAEESVREHLARKVDLRHLAHLEQLETLSAPDRRGWPRVLATGFLGLVPTGAEPSLPADTAWHPLGSANTPRGNEPTPEERGLEEREPTGALPPLAFDHGELLGLGVARLRAKLSYTNIAFGLAPAEFTISELRRLYEAALGHPVAPTNLQRVLERRAVIEPTGGIRPPARVGGRPAALYRFRAQALTVTDHFAVLGPPMSERRTSGGRTSGGRTSGR